MDEVWQSFNQTAGTAYVAVNENAITLCSSGMTAWDALNNMADLIKTYDKPVVLATSLYLDDDDRYFMNVVISGYKAF